MGRPRRVWTDAVEQYLFDNVNRMKDIEIALELTRITGYNFTVGAIKFKRRKLKLEKKKGWRPTEL